MLSKFFFVVAAVLFVLVAFGVRTSAVNLFDLALAFWALGFAGLEGVVARRGL